MVVPKGATQLLLGFVDGWYNDNTGSLTVKISTTLPNLINGTDGADNLTGTDGDDYA